MKDSKYFNLMLFSLGIFLILGISYAYFGTNIIGNEDAKKQTVMTGNLELTFTDTTEMSLDNAFPGDSFTKTISVKNTGTLDASYNLVWTKLTNEIINDELVIEATCKRLNSSNTEEGTCEAISQTPIKSNTIKKNISIEPSITHEYTIKVTFIDTGSLQDYNKNKTFEGKLGITESSVKAVYCTFDGTLTQGAEYINGQYTYRYMKEGKYADSGLAWQDITPDGWGVQLTDKASTDAVTSKVCTYINNKPIVSMSYMFSDSKATTLDVSNFDTSNVTTMSSMFERSKATTLDLSNFNTSKVTNMSHMFSNSQTTILDVSNFDTSNVTDMSYMFTYSQATTLDVSNFNTSNVTNMGYMFFDSKATTLDLSNFDTSKVMYMDSMFAYSQATTIDVSNFNTSNVTDMWNMFRKSKVTTLDVSNFDTSNVTDMGYMFYNSTNLKTIYVSNKFNTDKVTYSTNMFSGCTNLVGGAGTKYDSTKIDKTYARIDGGTSSPGYFTSIPEPNSFSSDSWMTIVKAVKSGNISKYNVGDTKTVNLGTYGTHTLRVANISKSDSCGNSGYSESGCGFVIEFADIITNRVINSTSTTRGSWSATTIRTFVNNDIYNLLPTDLKNGILNTNVITGHGNSEGNNSTSTDKLYLLSPIEIYGSVSTTYDSAINVTNQLDYYKQNNVSLNSYDSAIKNTVVSGGTGGADAWWTRTPAQMMDGQFMMVTNTGNLYSTYLTQQLGVSPAFRIG